MIICALIIYLSSVVEAGAQYTTTTTSIILSKQSTGLKWNSSVIFVAVWLIIAVLGCLILLCFTKRQFIIQHLRRASEISRNTITQSIAQGPAVSYSLVKAEDGKQRATPSDTVVMNTANTVIPIPNPSPQATTNSGESLGGTTLSGNKTVFAIPGFLSVTEGDDFTVDEALTKGGGGDIYTGTAFKSRLLIYGDTVAIKRVRNVKSEHEAESSAGRERFFQELSITYSLQSCKNIVRILGYSENPASLIMKYYPDGSLYAWLNRLRKRKQQLKPAQMTALALDVAHGLQAIHNHGFVHADIKSTNILVDNADSITSKVRLVITDFGISQITSEKPMHVKQVVITNVMGLSMLYAAPEVIQDYRKNSQQRFYPSDIYAFAMVLTEIVASGKLQLKDWTLVKTQNF
eukprot:Partr_v1_DN28255_c0_g1_i1_m76197 putative protein kinase kinase kinase